MKFLKPIDGDVLFSVADGEAFGYGLWTNITLSAPSGRKIRINGIPATEKNGVYAARIFIDAYRNHVEALDEESGQKLSMVIYWFRKGYRTYRLGVDDVIWCLENIWRNQDTYTSIFDIFYYLL